MNDLAKTIQACERGDRKAQKHLYEHCFDLFIGTCMRYYNERELAVAAFQNGMLKILTNLDKFEKGTQFYAWAKTILVRTILNDLKSSKSYRGNVDLTNWETYSPASTDSLDSTLDSDSLLQLLDTLPESEKVILNLFAIDGYNHKAIGELLGVAEGTSRWLLNKARASMRQAIHLEESRTKTKIA